VKPAPEEYIVLIASGSGNFIRCDTQKLAVLLISVEKVEVDCPFECRVDLLEWRYRGKKWAGNVVVRAEVSAMNHPGEDNEKRNSRHECK
jgi:hypothetical protein